MLRVCSLGLAAVAAHELTSPASFATVLANFLSHDQAPQPLPQSSSCPASYTVSVFTPCQGIQTVSKGSSCSVYSGGTGDFTLVVLYAISVGGDDSWEFQLLDYNYGSQCFGVSYYRKKSASEDARGDYCKLVGQSTDCEAGEAVVTDI